MSDIADLNTLIFNRLATTVYLAFDGEPPSTPASFPYLCFYGDPGMAYASRYARAGGSRRAVWTGNVVAAGHSRTSAMLAAQAARDVLTDWEPVAGGGQVVEIATSGPITDGPEGDRRTSLTLTFRCHIPRS